MTEILITIATIAILLSFLQDGISVVRIVLSTKVTRNGSGLTVPDVIGVENKVGLINKAVINENCLLDIKAELDSDAKSNIDIISEKFTRSVSTKIELSYLQEVCDYDKVFQTYFEYVFLKLIEYEKIYTGDSNRVLVNTSQLDHITLSTDYIGRWGSLLCGFASSLAYNLKDECNPRVMDLYEQEYQGSTNDIHFCFLRVVREGKDGSIYLGSVILKRRYKNLLQARKDLATIESLGISVNIYSVYPGNTEIISRLLNVERDKISDDIELSSSDCILGVGVNDDLGDNCNNILAVDTKENKNLIGLIKHSDILFHRGNGITKIVDFILDLNRIDNRESLAKNIWIAYSEIVIIRTINSVIFYSQPSRIPIELILFFAISDWLLCDIPKKIRNYKINYKLVSVFLLLDTLLCGFISDKASGITMILLTCYVVREIKWWKLIISLVIVITVVLLL